MNTKQNLLVSAAINKQLTTNQLQIPLMECKFLKPHIRAMRFRAVLSL